MREIHKLYTDLLVPPMRLSRVGSVTFYSAYVEPLAHTTDIEYATIQSEAQRHTSLFPVVSSYTPSFTIQLAHKRFTYINNIRLDF